MTPSIADYYERLEMGTVDADEWTPCISCGEWVKSEFNSTRSELGWEHNECAVIRVTPREPHLSATLGFGCMWVLVLGLIALGVWI